MLENQEYPRFISFEVKKGRSFYFFFAQYLLIIFSLGFYSPWARNKLSKYLTQNAYFIGKRFNLRPYPVHYSFFLIWLGIILFFLLGYWYINLIFIPYFIHHYCKRLTHSYSYRGLEFSFSGQLNNSYKICFILIFSSLFSLGFAYPWALGFFFRYYLNNFKYAHFKGLTQKLNYSELYKSFFLHILIPLLLCLIVLLGYIYLVQNEFPRIEYLYNLMILLPIIFISIFLVFFTYTIHTFNKLINSFEFDKFISLHIKISSAELFSHLFKWIFLTILTLGIYYPIGKLNFISYLIKNIRILFLGNLKNFLKLTKL